MPFVQSVFLSSRRSSPFAAGRPSPLRAPGAFLELLESPRVAVHLRARRGSTPSRHDEAVTTRPTAPRLLPCRFLPFGPCSRRARPPLHSFPFLQSRAAIFFFCATALDVASMAPPPTA